MSAGVIDLHQQNVFKNACRKVTFQQSCRPPTFNFNKNVSFSKRFACMQIDLLYTICMQIDYLVSPIMSLKGIIGLKWANIRDTTTTHAVRLQPFRLLNYLYVVFLEKRRCCCSLMWKGSFKWCAWRKIQWQKREVFFRFFKNTFYTK